jgi:hypothetical protein
VPVITAVRPRCEGMFDVFQVVMVLPRDIVLATLGAQIDALSAFFQEATSRELKIHRR